ncbi:MAG: hypothetical protein M1825_004225 [Sarcosagium campestre]|nr:MAG: hypothetical protein M1825_004225 [Sarcosagium campestre]
MGDTEEASSSKRRLRATRQVLDDFNDFDHVFAFQSDYSYDSKTVGLILSNRQSLKEGLFYDKLLALFNILPAEDFADRFHLPGKYAIAMRGLWYMDRMQFQIAVEYLTQPSLGTTFPEDILSTLIHHAPANDMTLPLAYCTTVSPDLTSSKAIDMIHSVLCRVSVSEAFYSSRTYVEHVHKRLFEQLVTHTLSLPPGDERGAKCAELINQPFTAEEEAWLDDFLLQGEGKILSGAKDTLMTRWVGTGKYQKAIAEGAGVSGRRVDGVSWDVLQHGLRDGLGHYALPS